MSIEKAQMSARITELMAKYIDSLVGIDDDTGGFWTEDLLDVISGDLTEAELELATEVAHDMFGEYVDPEYVEKPTLLTP